MMRRNRVFIDLAVLGMVRVETKTGNVNTGAWGVEWRRRDLAMAGYRLTLERERDDGKNASSASIATGSRLRTGGT